MNLPDTVEPMDLTVESHLFGTLTVPADTAVYFADGIPGFEDASEYVLLPAARGGSYWLQCTTQPKLAFFLVEARLIDPAAFGETPDLMAIVTLPGGVSPEASANMRAPLLIDRANRAGVQLIGIDETWSTAHPVDLAALLR